MRREIGIALAEPKSKRSGLALATRAPCRKSASTRSSSSACCSRALHALIEIAGGIALYLFSTDAIVGAISRWSYDELIEDRNDWIATTCSTSRDSFSVASTISTLSTCSATAS